MSLVGGGGLVSQLHLNGGGCISRPYNSDAEMLTGPIVPVTGSDFSANNSKVEKTVENSPVVEKRCASVGIVTCVDNLLPSPVVVIHAPDSIQMQWDRRYHFIPEPVGLLNAGNTCFLNSVLQCLTFTAPLANFFLNNGHKKDSYCGDFCIMCRMQSHVKTCFTINSRVYRPNGILERLQMIARHMERGRQEDAHEFLRCLTEAMQKRLLITYKHLDPISQETTLLNQIFGGYLRSQVVCCNCGAVSNTYEPFLDLSLDVKDVGSVEEAMKNFIRVETLDNENKYGCDSCHLKVKAYKRFTVHQAPRVLTFQLKRYSANSSIKLNNRTNFPLTLDIYRYLSDTLDGKPTHIYYELYGVLVHCGLTTTSGHYYCCAKSSNKNWYKLNDGTVTQIQVSDVLREEAYLLFYIQSGVKKTGSNAPAKVPSSISSLSQSGCTITTVPGKVVTNGLGSPAVIGPHVPNTGCTGGKFVDCGKAAALSTVIGPPSKSMQNGNLASEAIVKVNPPQTMSLANQPAGITSVKTTGERCKISFNIRPVGIGKSKNESVTEFSASKLVPYEDCVSDESESESAAAVVCRNEEDSKANDKCDEKLSNEILPLDSCILPSDTSQTETAVQVDAVVEDSATNETLTTVKLLEQGVTDSAVLVNNGVVKYNSAVEDIQRLNQETGRESRDEFKSSKRINKRHKKSKVHKRRKRRSSSTSSSESSDESEVEYVWVEKCVTAPKSFRDSNQMLITEKTSFDIDGAYNAKYSSIILSSSKSADVTMGPHLSSHGCSRSRSSSLNRRHNVTNGSRQHSREFSDGDGRLARAHKKSFSYHKSRGHRDSFSRSWTPDRRHRSRHSRDYVVKPNHCNYRSRSRSRLRSSHRSRSGSRRYHEKRDEYRKRRSRSLVRETSRFHRNNGYRDSRSRDRSCENVRWLSSHHSSSYNRSRKY